MLATKREEISRVLEEADQEISRTLKETSQIASFDSMEKTMKKTIYANNLLCVYLFTTVEYCLKTAFEFNMEDTGWRNHFGYFADQADRFGYKENVKNQLNKKKREEKGFISLRNLRSEYVHQRKDVQATLGELKQYFDCAKDIINLIIEVMPDRYFFQPVTEGQYIDDSSEQLETGIKIDYKELVEPLVRSLSSSELPNLELVIRIQNKRFEEQEN